MGGGGDRVRGFVNYLRVYLGYGVFFELVFLREVRLNSVRERD